MKDNMAKIYAAFRSGCLGNNILDAYFPFFANIICEENWDVVDETQVAKKFESKYHIPVPLTFVRQVLGVGMQNNAINNDHGKYSVRKDIIAQYKFDSQAFDIRWKSMADGFKQYCVSHDFDIVSFDIDTRILSCIEKYDDKTVSGEELNAPDNADTFDYAWSKYLSEIAVSSPVDFDFVASLSYSNIMKEAVFFVGDGRDSFKGLNVYFDSPMIFAILGIDSPIRTSSCKYLLDKMQSSGCIVQIFDHNFQEVDGILSRAAGWAVSPQYDIRKANNAVRFFHDNRMDDHDICEFCESLEDKLAQLNITIKKTDYDTFDSDFQEDEKQIYKMIESRYQEQSQLISEEKKQSIIIDVRSIIMVYRARKGQTATRVQASRDLMLTLNGTIANISKNYESNKSINAGHIPACISVDLFGAILWLFSPAELIAYQRKQLLADCYISLQPTRKLLNKYVESLENARSAGEIDEKKFLFMRSHTVINDALMNVTKGDYARFNERTYLEVYDEIQAIAEKKYEDEAQVHRQTKDELTILIRGHQEDQQKIQSLSDDVNELKDQLEERNKRDFNNKCRQLGWVFTLLLFGLPYVVLMVFIEIVKSMYSNFNFYSVVRVGLLVVLSVIIALLFQKGKNMCFSKIEKHLRSKINK